MKALISPLEQRETGFRVADVHSEGFEIAPPFFWVDCSDDMVADQFWYDPSDETFKPVPVPEPIVGAVTLSTENQPTVDGAQTL